jgi:hypothetical protein
MKYKIEETDNIEKQGLGLLGDYSIFIDSGFTWGKREKIKKLEKSLNTLKGTLITQERALA